MDNHLKKLVETRLKVLGTNASKAALGADLGRTFINDILAGRKRTVRPDAIDRLARALRVAPEEVQLAERGVWLERWTRPLLEVVANSDPQTNTEPLAIPADTGARPRASLMKDIPLVGVAMGSIIQNNITGLRIDHDPIDYVFRPPAMTGARDLYAMLVAGESMVPMHQPGSLIFVTPHRPAEKGDTVIVQTRLWDKAPAQSYVKILRNRTAERLVLEQLHPAATIEIPLSVVDAVHKVLTTRELFGL